MNIFTRNVFETKTKSKKYTLSSYINSIFTTLQTMPQLSFTVTLKLFLLLRVLPVAETLGLYLLLISGVSFIALSICALICITDVKNKTQKKVQKQKKPIASWTSNGIKKHEYKSEEPKSPTDIKNKEMDVYFCSLLSPNNEDNDDVKVPLTSSTD